jgi:hypothetical protein
MLLITMALMIEAKPLKSRYRLEAASGHPFPVYINSDRILIVTGTGALRAAAATGWALGRFNNIDSAINLGFAGGGSRSFSLHQWHLINSIRDEVTGRMQVPDLVWDFKLPEASLMTVGKPVETGIDWNGLVDMEGSGFYEAARHFLSPDRIVLLKWVSDHFSGTLDAEATREAFMQSLPHLDPVLRHFQGLESPVPAVDSDGFVILLDRMNLTETQQHYLRKWIRGYLARGGDMQRLFDILPPTAPRAKPENKRLFEEVKNVLKG